jgi:hypothetical protein
MAKKKRKQQKQGKPRSSADKLFCRAYDKAVLLKPGEPSTLTEEENAELLKRIDRFRIRWEAFKERQRKQRALLEARMRELLQG